MSAGRWWIAAEGRTWGPYPDARLTGFRDEGRFGPESLVAREEAGPFAPAAETPELARLFAAEGPGDPEAAAGTLSGEVEASAATPASRPLLVLTDAPQAEHPAFEAALGGHGEAVRLRPGLWLARVHAGAAALRNALSRRMDGASMLLVVEAPLSAAAWFNLDGGTDRALRRLWAEPALALPAALDVPQPRE